MSPSHSELSRIATLFVEAFDNLSAPDHLALRDPTCTHIFAPSSLGIRPKSNEAFAAHIVDNIRPLLDRFPVTPKEIDINETGGQITIWATATPYFKEEVMGDGGKEEWDYAGEYIFILNVNEAGKIARILEFLDSKATERLRGLMTKARENLGKKGDAW
jgi:ketosteroid isomerase-like protein